MKRLILATLALTVPLAANAAANISPALQKYVERSVQLCPGSQLKFDPIEGDGPQGFASYRVTQTSTDSECGKMSGLFFSPLTGQVLIADIFELPVDPRPLDARVADLAQQLLKIPIAVTLDTTELPDHVLPVHITKQTQYGPFNYDGYIDGSHRFLLVGRRGNINTDPGTSLLEYLRASTGVTRSGKNPKVRIVELSDFECPTCKHAHETFEPFFKKNMSKISFTRMDLPLFDHHEWSTWAALGARAIARVAPDKYWSYVDFMFANQETITKATIDSVVKNFCDDHDIDWKKVEPIYHSAKERQDLLAQVSRAFDTGVNGTPTYIVDGQFVFYGIDGFYLRSVLESKLGIAPAPAVPPAKAPKPATKKGGK